MKRRFLFCGFSLFLLFIGCDKVEEQRKILEVSPTEIAVYSNGTAQLSTNVNDAIYSSKDTYYASVEPSGLVTGKKVGKTEIMVSSSNGSMNIPVTILPQYTLYPDMDGLIGKTLSDITKVMGSNYTTSSTTSGDTMYTYKQPTTYATGIGFTLKSGKCSSIIVAVSTSYTSMISKYLAERYNIVGMQNDYYFFLNHGEEVTIALTVYSSSAIAVMYMENTSKATGSIEFSEFDSFRGVIEG